MMTFAVFGGKTLLLFSRAALNFAASGWVRVFDLVHLSVLVAKPTLRTLPAL